MEVVFGDEGGLGGVAPVLGIQMEAEDDIWAGRIVHKGGAAANLAGAVEKAFAFLGDREGCDAFTFVPQGGGGLFSELGGAEMSEWIRTRAGEPHFGAEDLQALHEEFGDAERHVAFDDGLAFANLEPAFLDFRPLASDMAGVDGDAQSGQWLAGLWGNLTAWPPETRSRIWRGSGEFQNVGRLSLARANARSRGRDRNKIRCRTIRSIDIIQETGEFLASDCLLKFVELGPIRGLCERAEFRRHTVVKAGEKNQ